MQISPGKAYVKGYPIEKISTGFIDVPKPRSTKTIEQEAVTYSTGDPLFVNNVFGSPSLGIGTTATVSLIDRRRGNSGSEIGLARLYDFKAQSGSFVNETQYNLINDTLAARTYDESGDYYVKPFEVFAKESLNDQIGNKGIYTSEQKTQQGNIPSDDLMVMQISPGKAYVKGYGIEKISTGFIDVPKPRSTKTVEQEAVSYTTGDPLFVNNVFGSPSLGIGTTATVALMSRRRGDASIAEIGLARLYDFKAQSGSFVNQTTQYETRLFDIKTFTNIKK